MAFHTVPADVAVASEDGVTAVLRPRRGRALVPERRERPLTLAERHTRADGIRALLPLVAGRPRGTLRTRARRLRPRRLRPRRPGPRRDRRRQRRAWPERGGPSHEAVRPEDAFFLYTQTRAVAQQVGGIAVLEETSLTFPQVRDEVQRRLACLPALRRRLDPPGRWWRRPAWVLDDSIDVADHLTEKVIGADGHPSSFADLVDDFFSRPVSLRGAPWEMHFVRGLDGGACALIVKLHHAMGDGFAAIDTLSGLLDDLRCRPDHPATPPPGDEPARGGLPVLARRWVRGTGLVLAGLWSLGRGGRAPRSGINGPMRTPSRHFVSLALPAGEVRDTARTLGVSTSELVLTVVADALHRLLAGRGESARSLLAMVPRSMRTPRTRRAAGNWTGGARVSLPVAAMSPLSRLRETQRRLRRSLRYGEPQASRFLMRAMGALPAPLEARVARWTYRSRWFNLIVSVIPGPRRPYSFAGVRLTEVYPVLPLADEVGLAVGVLSWGEALTVGMTTDVTLLSDADQLAEEVRASFTTFRRVATGE